MDEPRHEAVAEVTRPHGTGGELRLRLYDARSELLLGRPPVRLRLPDGRLRPAQLTAVRPAAGAMLVRLAGCCDRAAAEQLRGARVEVPRSYFAPTAADEYYHCDLEGCTVVLAGALVGVVARVASYPSCDALVVEQPGGSEIEVPLLAAYVAAVDLACRRIELATLEGLG